MTEPLANAAGSRAVQLDAPGHYRIVPAPSVPGGSARPGPGEVRVRVAAAGLCGSDRDLFAGTRPAPYASYPVVPGHEWSGTVEAVGAGVNDTWIGRAVVAEGFRACSTCGRCRAGETNLCLAAYDETGFTQPGAFADHLVLPARLLHPLPEPLPRNANLSDAALLEPAACVTAAIRRARPEPGERVAIVGGGTLGMLATQLIAAQTPAELLVLDTRRDRADLVTTCGGTTFTTPENAEAHNAAFDTVIETAGASDTALTAARLARRGGRVVLTGIPDEHASGLPPDLLVKQQLTLSTVFGAPSWAWTAAIAAFQAGALQPNPLITHELPLEQYAAALDLIGAPGVGKVLLRP